jgi:hypothetical protein
MVLLVVDVVLSDCGTLCAYPKSDVANNAELTVRLNVSPRSTKMVADIVFI